MTGTSCLPPYLVITARQSHPLSVKAHSVPCDEIRQLFKDGILPGRDPPSGKLGVSAQSNL